MFISLLLLNPTWSIGDIQARMLNAGAAFIPPERTFDRGKVLLEYIQSFINAMDCILPPDYSKDELEELGLFPILCTQEHRLNRFDLLLISTVWNPDGKIQRRLAEVRNKCGQFISNITHGHDDLEITSGWEKMPEVDSPYAK